MISLNLIFLFFVVSNDTNTDYSPDKLFRLARTGLKYQQDMYGLARLRYIVRKYPESEYANKAFERLYVYYLEKDEFISAFMILEEFQTQFFDDPFIASELYELARRYYKSGDYEKALRIYHKLSTDYPESEYTEDIEDVVSGVEYIAMGGSSILGNLLWKFRLSLKYLFDKFEIPYEVSHYAYFLILQSFLFLFIIMLSYILFISKKQNQNQIFWSPNDSAFIVLLFGIFVFYVIFHFIGCISLGDNIGDFPRFFQYLSLSVLSFSLFKKNNLDYKNCFLLDFKKLKKWFVIFFAMLIALYIFVGIFSFIYSRTNATIVVRDLEGHFRLNFSRLPLTFYYFFSIVLFGPFVEEIMYRGILYKLLNKKVGVFYGIIFSALLFAFMHDFTSVTFYKFFGIGIILALIFQKTKSLTLVILIHSFVNFLGVFLIYFI